MNSTLHLLKFNNYFNRQIKKLSSLDEYDTFLVGDIIVNYNFNPNDDVNTSIVINWPYDEAPNYLLVIDQDTGEIASRWFIIESRRTRALQYQLTLKRDIIADHYDSVINATTYIEKAILDESDPLIFNSEGIRFNQIKKSETLLKDKTNAAWIIGYFDNKYSPINNEISGTYNRSADYTYDTIKDFPYLKYLNTDSGKITNYSFRINFTEIWNRSTNTVQKRQLSYIEANSITNTVKTNIGGNVWNPVDSSINGYVYQFKSTSHSLDLYKVDENWTKSLSEFNKNLFYKQFWNIQNLSDTIFNELLDLDNKIIYLSNSKKYYKLSLVDMGEDSNSSNINTSTNEELFNSLSEDAKSLYFSIYEGGVLESSFGKNSGNLHNSFTGKMVIHKYSLKLIELVNPEGDFTIKWPEKGARHLNDAPYSIFCIPYPADGDVYVPPGSTFNITNNVSLAVSTALANAMQPSSASGFLYDLQLLPYCPISQLVDNIPYDNFADVVKEDGQIFCKVYFAASSDFTVNINYSVTIPEKKISKECDVYRISSPNFANFDEFSPAMNDGVDYIHIDCTYKPYNPYINVHINYKNLYGKDFDDSRGLICNGDFSLPLMTDQFQLYEINNKNYSAIFDRTMDNLEVSHKWDMAQKTVGALAGTASGAATGSMMGIPVLGGMLSAAGGTMDLVSSEALYKENISYRTDMYNYNLDNIKAKSSGLAKTSGFNINNKLWPFIEYYTCTDEEKEAFREKLKYNGMTVMKIGKIKDYLKGTETFIQGQIIRIEDLNNEYHMASEIANEIKRGIFIGG